MALNIFSASFIKRSGGVMRGAKKPQRKTGGSAIAHAAYCRRETLVDERTGIHYDGLKMGRGQEAEWKGIYIPSHAPEEFRNASTLWNAVEVAEDGHKRHASATLMRSFIMTFPKEISSEQRIMMLKDFMRESARKGWIVDGVIHGPDQDNENWHAHANMPMRHVSPDGFKGRINLGKTQAERTAELNSWKDLWSRLGERQLKVAGFEAEAARFRWGHLKNSEQTKKANERGDFAFADEIEREPQEHMGPVAWGKEKRGERTPQGDRNREVNERNERRRWDREVKREDKAKGPVAERIQTAYDMGRNGEDFQRRIEKDGMFVARVTKHDMEEYGPDYSDPREELKRLEWLKAKGAWMTQTGGYLRLNSEQRMRAGHAYERYQEKLEDRGRENTFTLDGYVKYVQLQTQRQIEHLTEYKKVLDFADGGHTRKSDFFAKAGEYVVVTKGGHVYRLNQATTGDTPKEVKEFLKDLDQKPIRSVREAREAAEEMRLAERDKWAAIRMENATRGYSKSAAKVADKVVDRAFNKVGSYSRVATNSVAKTFGALATAMGSVADMFTGFFPTQREQERKAAEQQHLRDEQRGYSRER